MAGRIPNTIVKALAIDSDIRDKSNEVKELKKSRRAAINEMTDSQKNRYKEIADKSAPVS